MNLEEFRASINKLQDLDSFPGTGATQWHRIVKKQMANSDYRDARKSKRSVTDVTPEVEVENVGPLQPRSAETAERSSLFRKLKDFAKEKDLFTKRTKKNDPNKARKEQQKKQEATLKQMEKERQEQQKQYEEECKKALKEKQMRELKERLTKNRCLIKVCRRIPDSNDYRCYYECEAAPNGCLKLKHRRCPKGQFFSFKYLKCLKPIPAPPEEGGVSPRGKGGGKCKRKSIFKCKKVELPDINPEYPEPANEWMDANQSSNQKIDLPNEFKPQKKPSLRIYHLRMKRNLEETHGNDASVNLRGGYAPPHGESHPSKVHGIVKKHGARHHLPRSFVIRIHKQEDKITDSDENENDNDEDDEENDEEDEEDEGDDEDEDSEEEETKKEKSGAKESIKELFRSAKEAVTNRARFEDPTELAISRPANATRPASALKGKKSDDSALKKSDKKVLIDANIKVDSAISGILRSFLKAKRKDKEANAGFLDDLETDASLGPELTDIYEHLMLNNPRLKRYFRVNCGEGGN